MRPVRVVSLRPPSFAGPGDARRAASIQAALAAAGAEVRVSAFLKTNESLKSAILDRRVLIALVRVLASSWHVRPLQCLLMDAIASARPLADRSKDEFCVYITSRVVPVDVPDDSFVDFVDSLSNNFAVRARHSTVLRPFWSREAKLLKTWETRLAQNVAGSVAVTAAEAALIGEKVGAVPNEMTHREAYRPGAAAKADPPTAIFAGNLYYQPNDEAARWIVSELAPELVRRGWDPQRLVIAGRRPRRKLVNLAAKAGVTVLADVPDLLVEIQKSAVALVPMSLGGGVQGKALDMLAARIPIVLTPKANTGLGLADNSLVRVRPRDAVQFADAMVELLDVSKGGYPDADLPADVRVVLEQCSPAFVQKRWYDVLRPHIDN
jgi:glycosyltransferase involved in cell wall biosynthesis